MQNMAADFEMMIEEQDEPETSNGMRSSNAVVGRDSLSQLQAS